MSSQTTKALLDRGVQSAEDETCLPVKMHYGHVIDLKDRVDYLFLPGYKSLDPKKYMCPKIIGLPDMIAHSVAGLPRLIRPRIDAYRDPEQVEKAFLEVGRILTRDMGRVRQAYRLAGQKQDEFEEMLFEGWSPDQAISRLFGQAARGPQEARLKIGIIGHSYVICDRFINQDLLGKLDGMGVAAVLSDMVPSEIVHEETRGMRKELFWSFGKKLIGAAYHLIRQEKVQGLICLSAFNCGSDSMVEPFISAAARGKVPYMSLTIDEHTGEAGLVTRLEAFVDMIRRRRNLEVNLPAHG